MKKLISVLLKIVLSVFAAALCVLLVAAVVFGFKGHSMYQKAVDEESIEDRVSEIENIENYVSYSQLPKVYVEAVVSVEDRRFWDHGGVDWIAICRAAVNDVKAWDLVEGGSTITQQLAKNLMFTEEKEFERKFAEVFAAFEIESNYSKEKIFELYVNTIYFGSGYYGIYDAAMGYFGKAPWELSESEAVMLAGLPNAPSSYSPDVNPQLAVERMNCVLDSMIDNGVLTEEEAETISAQWTEETYL